MSKYDSTSLRPMPLYPCIWMFQTHHGNTRCFPHIATVSSRSPANWTKKPTTCSVSNREFTDLVLSTASQPWSRHWCRRQLAALQAKLRQCFEKSTSPHFLVHETFQRTLQSRLCNELCLLVCRHLMRWVQSVQNQFRYKIHWNHNRHKAHYEIQETQKYLHEWVKINEAIIIINQ